MKSIFILISFFVLTWASESLQFVDKLEYETNYEEALQKAKKQKKNLMLVLVDENCPWCTKLKNNTLNKSNVDFEIKKDYIPLILKRKSYLYPKNFYTQFVPYIFFIDSITEDSIYEIIGFKNQDMFLEELKEARL